MSASGDFAVVLDAGSKYFKAGFAGELFPRSIFHTVVGRFRDLSFHEGLPEVYCGEVAMLKRGISQTWWPVKEGLITDWDKIELVWHHVFFKELHVPPESAKVLHAVHPLVPKGDREKMAEIMFETFGVSGLNLVKAPVLVLYASGRTTGVVFENGACSSYICPVFEGFPLAHTTSPYFFNGEALSEMFNNLLSKRGYSFTTPTEKDIINNIKAKLCYIAQDYAEECAKYDSSLECLVHYNLPDGQQILVGEERFKCPEVLFQPKLAGADCPSIQGQIVQSIEKCDMDIRDKLYSNIVVSGGSAMISGLVSRLQVEVTRRANVTHSRNISVAIDDIPNKQNAAWIGGSIIGSLPNFQDHWMTQREYNDIGPDRVNYKFF